MSSSVPPAVETEPPDDEPPILTVQALRAAMGGTDARVLCVFGSVDFFHPDSEALCRAIGRALAERVPDLTLATGANAAVHEVIARSFVDASNKGPDGGGAAAKVFHLAPVGYDCAFGHGTKLRVGRDMAERRTLLARVGDAALSVEGGPGTADEMSTAWMWGVPLVPLGRSGGASAGMFDAPSGRDRRREFIAEKDWEALWDDRADVEVAARTVAKIVGGIFDEKSTM